jgi:hypothetical protein
MVGYQGKQAQRGLRRLNSLSTRQHICNEKNISGIIRQVQFEKIGLRLFVKSIEVEPN